MSLSNSPSRLSVCVQTHPSRAELLRLLLAELTPAHVFVAHDPTPDERPSALRTYLRALRLTPSWSTHHLVIQDDVEVCSNFVAAAAQATAARPDSPLAFFVSAQAPEMAHKIRAASGRGDVFAEIETRRWAPVVATSWPVALVWRFLEYVDEKNWPKRFGSDDEAVGIFFRAERIQMLATVPSLVEHPDNVPSIIGGRVRAGRRAAVYIGDGDPLSVRWR